MRFGSAIARIDRMGQTRPTEGVFTVPSCTCWLTSSILLTVFCYYAEGTKSTSNALNLLFIYFPAETVEKNILDLAARQGLSLYTKGNSAGTLNVTSFALDAGKKMDSPSKGKKKIQKGDFINK